MYYATKRAMICFSRFAFFEKAALRRLRRPHRQGAVVFSLAVNLAVFEILGTTIVSESKHVLRHFVTNFRLFWLFPLFLPKSHPFDPKISLVLSPPLQRFIVLKGESHGDDSSKW